MNNYNNSNDLIQILEDPTSRIDEKDDAVMALSKYNEDKVITALSKFCENNRNEVILASCGESLAEIWLSLNKLDKEILNSLPSVAKQEAESFLKARKPEWFRD